MPVIEIEVDSDTNTDLLFEPVQERVRGRFLPQRVRQESAGKLAMKLPNGLPGQRIKLNTDTGDGAILEPLAGADHAATRKTLAELVTGDENAVADRLKFDPASRVFPAVDVALWTNYMCKAVKAGVARVTQGALPDEPPTCKPRVFSSLSRGPQPDQKDATIAQLTALLLGKLTPAERKELAATLGTK